MIARHSPPDSTLFQWLIVLGVNLVLILLLMFAVHKVRTASRHGSRPGNEAVDGSAASVRPTLLHANPIARMEARP